MYINNRILDEIFSNMLIRKLVPDTGMTQVNYVQFVIGFFKILSSYDKLPKIFTEQF